MVMYSGLFFNRLYEILVKVLDIPQVYDLALVVNNNNQLINKAIYWITT